MPAKKMTTKRKSASVVEDVKDSKKSRGKTISKDDGGKQNEFASSLSANRIQSHQDCLEAYSLMCLVLVIN